MSTAATKRGQNIDESDSEQFLKQQRTIHVTSSRQLSRSQSVHRELLCHHAEYFRGAFHGGFEEETNRVVNLEEEDERTFRMFVAWLYTQKVVPPTEARPCPAQSGKLPSAVPLRTQKRALAELLGLLREHTAHKNGSIAPVSSAESAKVTDDDSANKSDGEGRDDEEDDDDNDDEESGEDEECEDSDNSDAQSPVAVLPAEGEKRRATLDHCFMWNEVTSIS
ncbi:hypothetical protein LTR36_010858 [Oleoguttula mirabilis]|uniref:BTB domain-containing protein n=1 Tax=Oleoguttula mirabilis TaxID=1507867 RepID=A0AAV9J3R0_9PEZI|nr:hypothetical protein LTR36_010858 [Oleoguttula mirabilis]